MSIKNTQAMFSLTKRIEGVTRSMNAVTYNSMVAMIERVNELSPVGDVTFWAQPKKAPKGYRGGQFRGNWQLGVNAKPEGVKIGNIDPSGDSTVADNIGKIPVMASRGYKFYLTNNLPYALGIEEGTVSPRQSPPHALMYRAKREFAGMVREVVKDIKSNGGRVK